MNLIEYMNKYTLKELKNLIEKIDENHPDYETIVEAYFMTFEAIHG